jgi:predicted nucleotide-binding protein
VPGDHNDANEPFWKLLSLAARRFEERAEWPDLDDLIYDAAARGESWDPNLRGQIPNGYGFVSHDGTVVATGLGLIKANEAPRSVEALVHLVRLCVRLALQFRKDAKLSPDAIREFLGDDDFLLARAAALARSVPGLIGGGGLREDGWWWDITVSSLEYKDVQTVDDLESLLMDQLTQQRQLVAQATSIPYGQASWEGPPNTFDSQDEDLKPATPVVNAEECDPRNVFVVFGRDTEATQAIWTFLQALGLHPLDWDELVRSTGTATPYTGEVVAKAFDQVRAVVVLLTPDDEARLHDSLQREDDGIHELELTGQPRPNVFFEAGMAFGRHPGRTIVVEIGSLRPASDLSGLNVVRLSGTEGPLKALADRLEGAGCPVNRSHPAWLDTNRFGQLEAHRRRPMQTSHGNSSALPRGTRVPQTRRAAETKLTARLISQGSNDYLLEVLNQGETNVKSVTVEVEEDANNWVIMREVLPEYPLANLDRGEHVRMPVIVLMSGPVMTELRITAIGPDDGTYETSARLSIYG